MSSVAMPRLDRTLADLTLEQLCMSLTQALHEFLQAHTATIEAYIIQAQTPAGTRPEAAHAALTQEIAHVAHFVETLQTTLTALLQDFSHVDTKRVPPTRREPEAEGHASHL